MNSTRLLCTEFDFLGLFVLKGGVLIAHAICNGQTTHHGVAFISKLPAESTSRREHWNDPSIIHPFGWNFESEISSNCRFAGPRNTQKVRKYSRDTKL